MDSGFSQKKKKVAQDLGSTGLIHSYPKQAEFHHFGATVIDRTITVLARLG